MVFSFVNRSIDVNQRQGHHIIPIVVNKTRSCACKLKYLLLWIVNLEFFFFQLLFEKNGLVGRLDTKHFIGMALRNLSGRTWIARELSRANWSEKWRQTKGRLLGSNRLEDRLVSGWLAHGRTPWLSSTYTWSDWQVHPVRSPNCT